MKFGSLFRFKIICPFCMKFHRSSMLVCPEKKIGIPPRYREALKHGIPPIAMFNVGHSGHGKTCFLSTFFHTIYDDQNEIYIKWPDFDFTCLDQKTITEIRINYVDVIKSGKLPPKTPIMFPIPLLFEVTLPRKMNGLTKLITPLMHKKVIFIFYDIGGETFQVDEKIAQNLPILKQINTLVFFIDLPTLIQNGDMGGSVTAELHGLLNTLFNAMMNLGQRKKKNLIICFTKADQMWEKEDIFGPLAKKIRHDIPFPHGLSDYFKNLKRYSDEIGKYVHERYPLFYNASTNHFRSVFFTSLSSLGCQPQGNTIPFLAPAHVWDPVLYILKLEKLL